MRTLSIPLTKQYLQQDEIANNIGVWQFKMYIKNVRIGFYLLRSNTHYLLAMTQPETQVVSSSAGLDDTIKVFNELIHNLHLNDIRNVVLDIRKGHYANV